jgi:hypothetical protein
MKVCHHVLKCFWSFLCRFSISFANDDDINWKDEYFDSESKITEQELPPIEAFYSSLSGECITEEDYAHAQTAWREFELQNIGQYHDLYVFTDVLSLADVFENFRDIYLNYYGLDAAHFYTSPGLT